MTQRAITFVIPVYKRPAALAGVLSSLIAQRNPNWRAICVFDGDDPETLANATYAAEHLKDERVTAVYAPHRGVWGHPAREEGLKLCETDFVCLTGHDNYYLPMFVEVVLSTAAEFDAKNTNVSMIHTDFLHLGNAEHFAGGYRYFPSAIQYGMVDMGSVVVNTELAQAVGFGEEFRSFEADFHWFSKIREKFSPRYFPVKAAAGHILYVHN